MKPKKRAIDPKEQVLANKAIDDLADRIPCGNLILCTMPTSAFLNAVVRHIDSLTERLRQRGPEDVR